MKFLSDRTLERLRRSADEPDLSGTHYRLLERVARGGMGAVVYATQRFGAAPAAPAIRGT
jgi:hypothetical protein